MMIVHKFTTTSSALRRDKINNNINDLGFNGLFGFVIFFCIVFYYSIFTFR
jgi:hypothetical protein